jgi:hypothetical protein
VNKETPKTYYEWLMRLNEHRLKCGPLEAFKDSRVHHALKPGTIGNVSYGMWDHQTQTGYLEWDRIEADQKREEALKNAAPRQSGDTSSSGSSLTDRIKPAPPIPDGDKDWDL